MDFRILQGAQDENALKGNPSFETVCYLPERLT